MHALHNSILTVELDDTNLALAVTDRRSGARWETPGAGFELQVYDIPCQHHRWYTTAGFDTSKLKYGENPLSACAIQIHRHSDRRASAQAEFTGLDLGFGVEFELRGAALIVTIPAPTWNFSGEKAGEVISLDCFPLFGGRPRGANGCLVLPHFGGAVRHFADRADRAARMAQALAADPASAYAHEMAGNEPDPDPPQSCVGMVYGLQANWRDLIAYPLWGAVAGDSGWAAYVPFGCGDADAGIVTSANQRREKICAAHARFYVREHAHDQRVDEDRQLVFTFLHERGLNYAAIGRVYRRYLIEAAGFSTLRAKANASSQTDSFVGAHWIQPMLALKRYYHFNNPNPDGKGILDVYWHCDQFAAELRRWKKAGIEKALVQIVGANSEGHDGNYPTYFPLEPRVGGEEGFKRLLAAIKELGYRSAVHVNIRSAMRPAPDFRAESVMRDRAGALFYEGSGPGGDGYGACPAVAGSEFARRNFRRLKQLGLDGGLYTDFMLGILFRCYHPLHTLTRRGYLDAVRDYLAKSNETFGASRLESVIAPILDQVDAVARINALHIADALLRGAELTARGLADEEVPLQAIILHGIVLYALDKTCCGQKDYWAHVLRLVTLGAKPIEELRGPQPQWDDLHALEYRVLCDQTGWLQFEFIENIERHGDATRTVYSDGTIVSVNHGNSSVPTGGRTLPARSFWVKPASPAHEELLVEEHRSILDHEPAVCPDGNIWPDGRPREGLALKPGQPMASPGFILNKAVERDG